MPKTTAERQRDYREKRLETDIRISVWLTPRAYAALTRRTTASKTSREKVINAMLEAA